MKELEDIKKLDLKGINTIDLLFEKIKNIKLDINVSHYHNHYNNLWVLAIYKYNHEYLYLKFNKKSWNNNSDYYFGGYWIKRYYDYNVCDYKNCLYRKIFYQNGNLKEENIRYNNKYIYYKYFKDGKLKYEENYINDYGYGILHKDDGPALQEWSYKNKKYEKIKEEYYLNDLFYEYKDWSKIPEVLIKLRKEKLEKLKII